MRSLTDILEDLVEYCNTQALSDGCKVQLVLPKKVLDRYSLVCQAKERILLHGTPAKESSIARLYCHNNGLVELFNDEDNMVVKKD